MKKTALLHSELSKVIAMMAHGDTILIGDAGMPCPKGVPFIDLALTKGSPRFMDVLSVILSELDVAQGYIAQEQAEKSPHLHKEMVEHIGDAFPLADMPHTDLKLKSANCRAMIRTGEFTPFANIILESGVVF